MSSPRVKISSQVSNLSKNDEIQSALEYISDSSLTRQEAIDYLSKLSENGFDSEQVQIINLIISLINKSIKENARLVNTELQQRLDYQRIKLEFVEQQNKLIDAKQSKMLQILSENEKVEQKKIVLSVVAAGLFGLSVIFAVRFVKEF
ncbi:Hypothetical_protein [Hexamita inflata]|uniref:Hypothetical_protein n=1 Tax=Hexamita inflata TaxID=28002 RepID=A0ABP1HLP1_9EUKA